jgi:hypothetical protein
LRLVECGISLVHRSVERAEDVHEVQWRPTRTAVVMLDRLSG